MKKSGMIYVLLVIFTLIVPISGIARDVSPIVTTDWLESNLKNSKVVILDIRKVEDYKAGHIPGAVNAFYGSWVVMRDGLRNEMPPSDDLFDTIGAAGIGPESLVVVVGKVDAVPDRTDISRVAWTLKYAGIENVAILDGGYNKWIADKKALSTDPFKATSKSYKGKVNEGLFVKKGYVMDSIGKITIVDVRESDFFQGKKKMDFVAKPGRIKGAVNLPTSQAYTKDGTFKSKDELAGLAAGAVGKDTSREIIIYCDTGKVCTSWAFLMTELLGYKNVKDYDGSTEEWMKDPAAPVEQ